MKYNIVTRAEFANVCKEMRETLNTEVTLHIFKHYVIGAIIDLCFYGGGAIVYDSMVYITENTNRSGHMYGALYNTPADSISEWINAVSVMMVG
ncbi:MAG: hypothetical protein [Caudoviricetes sp.]|nr:MAG: hypothetical protein [Caudoviricetes sp.]